MDGEETLDPRIQIELEKLNKTSEEINNLELDLDRCRSLFRHILTDSTQQLNGLAKKLGSCIDKARPYYEARVKARQAQIETQDAALRFERSCSQLMAAKEMVTLAEEGFFNKGQPFDPAWQEMLNHATVKVNEAEKEKIESEVAHMQTATTFSDIDQQVKSLQKDLKRNINKSRPYFDQKARFSKSMEEQKQKVDRLERHVTQAKRRYAETLRSLEQISAEIHHQRGEARVRREMGGRGSGVGAECPEPPVLEERSRTEELKESQETPKESPESPKKEEIADTQKKDTSPSPAPDMSPNIPVTSPPSRIKRVVSYEEAVGMGVTEATQKELKKVVEQGNTSSDLSPSQGQKKSLGERLFGGFLGSNSSRRDGEDGKKQNVRVISEQVVETSGSSNAQDIQAGHSQATSVQFTIGEDTKSNIPQPSLPSHFIKTPEKSNPTKSTLKLDVSTEKLPPKALPEILTPDEDVVTMAMAKEPVTRMNSDITSSQLRGNNDLVHNQAKVQHRRSSSDQGPDAAGTMGPDVDQVIKVNSEVMASLQRGKGASGFFLMPRRSSRDLLGVEDTTGRDCGGFSDSESITGSLSSMNMLDDDQIQDVMVGFGEMEQYAERLEHGGDHKEEVQRWRQLPVATRMSYMEDYVDVGKMKRGGQNGEEKDGEKRGGGKMSDLEEENSCHLTVVSGKRGELLPSNSRERSEGQESSGVEKQSEPCGDKFEAEELNSEGNDRNLVREATIPEDCVSQRVEEIKSSDKSKPEESSVKCHAVELVDREINVGSPGRDISGGNVRASADEGETGRSTTRE